LLLLLLLEGQQMSSLAPLLENLLLLLPLLASHTHSVRHFKRVIHIHASTKARQRD